MSEPTPRDLVVELLRTLDLAQTDWNPGSNGVGVIQMPSLYQQGSYQELECRLAEMRDSEWRPYWWHLSMRYRWGSIVRIPVPSRKTHKGRVPILPPRSELLIQGETLAAEQGEVRMLVQLYSWSEEVELEKVEVGLTRLLATMYGGNTSKVQLPLVLLYQLLGIDSSDRKGSHVQPLKGHLQGGSLTEKKGSWRAQPAY